MGLKLNLGCGDNRIPGWMNCDADVDITKPLPWSDDSADFIVIEHCVEHIPYYDAIKFFQEARRVLRIGGVLRVTVPSITQVMCCDDQTYFDWLKEKGWAPTADTRGAMHAILYCHGHLTAWTSTLMEATLYFAGFEGPRKCAPGISSHPALCGVEGHAKVIGYRFNAIESITFEGTKMTGDLSKDYDKSFYAMHQPWREEYAHIAELLVNELPSFNSAVDFGCGNGYIVDSLAAMGKTARGYDGSSNTLQYSNRIKVADVTQPMNVGTFDLAICTEVAEHVEERHANTLVENVCRAARHTIFFSAAQAGHGGHLHLNEQPRTYWIKKFAVFDFEVDHAATDRIVVALRIKNKKTWWFAQNCFVLRKRQGVLELENIIRDAMSRTKPPSRKVAIVVGGSERVWEDVSLAREFCELNNLEPEYFAANDMIQQFMNPIVACTLHPDKLGVWLAQRRSAGLPMPTEVWSHNGGSRVDHPHVTKKIQDWGGSSGMFAYQVAREKGHDRVILCGVPMTHDNHFVRKSKWLAYSAFSRAWEMHKTDMLPHVRSMSGGWTEELFGVPTPEWVNSDREIAA